MLNVICLQGRTTKDIELSTTPNGVNVCTFTLANDIGYGENKRTNFINCVAWRNTAELLNKHVKKGQMIVVSGELQVKSWEDRDGRKRYATEIVVKEFNFCESKEKKKEDNGGFEEFIPDPDDLPF